MQNNSVLPTASDLLNYDNQLKIDIATHFNYLLSLGICPKDNFIVTPLAWISSQNDLWSQELTRRHNFITTILNQSPQLSKEFFELENK